MEKTPEEYQAELMRLYHTVQASAPETASSPTPAPAAVPQPAAEPEMQQPETEPEETPQPPDAVPESDAASAPVLYFSAIQRSADSPFRSRKIQSRRTS